MEAIGAASSVIGIADAGIQTSLRLITFAGQVKTAPASITGIAEDVSLTSNILQQLGELMKQKVPGEDGSGHKCDDQPGDKDSGSSLFSASGLKTAQALGARCNDLFATVEQELKKASKQISSHGFNEGEKIKLSTAERLKWPFLQPRIQEIRGDLREVKESLMMLLQVTMLAYSRALAQSGSSTTIKDSKVIIVTPEEQISLIRSIVAAEKAKLRRRGKGDAQLVTVTEIPDNNEDEAHSNASLTSPSEDADPAFGITKFPVGGDGEEDDGLPENGSKDRRSPQSSPRSTHDSSPIRSSISEELEAWEIRPNANILENRLRIGHNTAIVPLEQSAIQKQLQLWQSDGWVNPWEQWSSLTQGEREAFQVITGFSGPSTDQIIWIHFGQPQELVIDWPQIKARSVQIVTKRKARPEDAADRSVRTFSRRRERERERERPSDTVSHAAYELPPMESFPIETKSMPIPAVAMADSRTLEVASGKEEAEKIVNNLIATYTTVRGQDDNDRTV